MSVLTREVVGVFPHVERTDKHRALRLQTGNERGISGRRSVGAIDLGAGDRGYAGYVEQILYRERHARERTQRLAVAAAGVDGLCPGARTLGRQRGEGIENRIALSNTLDRALDHTLGADRTGSDVGCDLSCRRPITCELRLI